MKRNLFSAALLAATTALSCSYPTLAAEVTNASVQRASCARLGSASDVSVTYKNVPGADGFGPLNQVVLAKTTSNGPVDRQRAGYVILASPPLPPATQSTGFRSIKIIFGQKGLYGDAVLTGKCVFTFVRPDGSEVDFQKSWSELHPSAPADWRSLNATTFDFIGVNVAECTLKKVVAYIDNEIIGAAVYLGDYYVQYRGGGTYATTVVKFPDAGCSVFPAIFIPPQK